MTKQMTIRYSERFFSIQGEGMYVGVPSVFFRTFGCNFRCMKFGLPRDTPKSTHNPEVAKLIADGVHETTKVFEDLPLVHTGCDTYASIYPEFKNLMKNGTIDEVVDALLSVTPQGKWTQDNGQDIHLIMTGGEPLLGWQRAYIQLFEHPRMKDLKNVTFETNTTQMLRPEFREWLSNQTQFRVTWSCSPKLSVSGESWEDAINPLVAADYYSIPNSDFYFKFVVNDEIDLVEVERAVGEYRSVGIECPVYLMPVGGRTEGYDLTVQQVAGIAMKNGWRFSPRLHVTLFGNRWNT
jgi:7-carboxy-7-deazaguanine synthase